MKSNRSFYNNDEGVSPIIATLILIVVAIIGAAAVGLIMGSFSNNVSKQAAGDGGASQASAQLNIAGSTTVQPVTAALIPGFEAQHQNLVVNNAPGGSGVGIASAVNGLVDLGAVSEPLTSSQMTTYPSLQQHIIGEGAIVVVATPGFVTNSTTGLGSNSTPISKADLAYIFNPSATATATADWNNSTFAFPAKIEICYRSDVSGTEAVFSNYLYGKTTTLSSTAPPVAHNYTISSGTSATVPTPESSNANIITEVVTPTGSGSTAAIGFCDFEYAADTKQASNSWNAKADILSILDGAIQTRYVASGTPCKNVGYVSSSTGLWYNDAGSLRADILATLQNSALTGNKAASGSTGSACYISGLTRPLSYVTNGAPSANAQAFLTYADSPATQTTFQQLGVFHPLDYTVTT